MPKLSTIYKACGLSVECEGMFSKQIPKDHQLMTVETTTQYDRSADYSEVGTGKSLSSYLYIMYMLLLGRRVVAVMPPNLIPQYISEFKRIITGHDFSMENYNIPLKKRMGLLHSGKNPHVSFMSYQVFCKLHKHFSSNGYTVLVCDESHAIKNVSTKNFKSVFMFLMKGDKFFLEMSATPCTGELRDAYAHIRLKDPTAYQNLAHFDRCHTLYAPVHSDQDRARIIGYRDQKTIQKRLNMNSVRHQASQVLDLLEPNVTLFEVPLSVPHLALYKKLLRERILEMGEELLIADNPQKLRQMALQIVTNVGKFTDKAVLDHPVQTLKQIQNTLPDGKKLLVFCVFRETIQKLECVFQHLNPALIFGGSNVPKNVNKFKEDPTCKIAFVNYISGGAGFNFQDCCHNILFYELSGIPSEYIQGIGRCQRQGQEFPVNVWIMRYTNTLTIRLISSALGRDEDISYVMRDKTSILESLRI